MASTVMYAAGPLTGGKSTLSSWWCEFGTDPETSTETDLCVLGLIVEHPIERLMNTIAVSTGVWKADGSHLFGRVFVDPDQPEFEWTFAAYGTGATWLFVERTASRD